MSTYLNNKEKEKSQIIGKMDEGPSRKQLMVRLKVQSLLPDYITHTIDLDLDLDLDIP
jgi:hypothetical protein